MHMRRPVRAFLALFVAYAIVLGAVAAPVLGHGFDPARQLCSQSASGNPDTDPASGDPRPQSGHDCCPGLCGGQVVLLPPALPADVPVSFSPIVRLLPDRDFPGTDLPGFKFARAPPVD